MSPGTDGPDYSAEAVQLHRDLSHIRRRPGMYVGDTGAKGLHHLVYELVFNSIDEAKAGRASVVEVDLAGDACRVRDDGGGIPIDPVAAGDVSFLEWAFTRFPTFQGADGPPFRVAGGLLRLGLKALSALSDRVEANVRRRGVHYRQEFRRGVAHGDLEVVGPSSETGTSIEFRPDPEIFRGGVTFDAAVLATRLRELAFLYPGVAKHFLDCGGGADFVRYLVRDTRPIHLGIFHYRAEEPRQQIEVAAQWTGRAGECVQTYANGSFTSLGGTHQAGFREAVTRVVRSLGRYVGAFSSGPSAPAAEDCRAGLAAVVAVQVAEPQFVSAIKGQLFNPEVQPFVRRQTEAGLREFFRRNPDDADAILAHVLAARDTRLARPRRGRR